MAGKQEEQLYKDYSRLSDAHLRAKQAELKFAIDNCKVTLGTKLWNAAEALTFGVTSGVSVGGASFAFSNWKALSNLLFQSGEDVGGAGKWQDKNAAEFGDEREARQQREAADRADCIDRSSKKNIRFSAAAGIAVGLCSAAIRYKRSNKLSLIMVGNQEASRLTVVDQILRDREVLELHPGYKRPNPQDVIGQALGDGQATGAAR